MSAVAPPRIWTVPIIIGVVSLACLVVSLVDDGLWDTLASLTLAAILVYATYKGVVTRG